jgi:hypothetical protein
VTEADDEPKPAQPVDRDAAGRFVAGNRAATANRGAKLRRAMEAAAAAESDPDRLAQVLRTLHERALAGDTQAARLWLEHTRGRPRERQPDVDVQLPEVLDSREAFGDAFVAIARCAAAGELEPDTARSLATLLQQVAEVVVDDMGSTEAVRRVVEQIVARRPAPPDALEQQRKLREFLVAASAEAEGDATADATNADGPLPEEGAP